MKGDPVRDLQGLIVEVRLSIGRRLSAEGRNKEAERVYVQTLKHAEVTAGEDSPLVGIVLLDLFDLYDGQERQGEANALWERIRKILLLHWHQ